ncbi:MAG: tRNA (adenosine(37)-N6)-threonylcarbamoyltransferase complex ATPase subunit type 1 TsaE [Myxococcota bacterium]
MSPDRSVVSRSADETRRLGAELGELLRGGDVVGVSGELGAGKTCLVQGIARGVGVEPAIPVTSPTFTLVGEYAGRVALRHADFYRVESYARLDDAGFADLLDETGVLVVEWPERFPDALPEQRLDIAMEIVSESERRIRLGGAGERAEELSRRLLERWA